MNITATPRPVLAQTEYNSTLWIGHLQHNANDRSAGQTFHCPLEGTIDNIQVFSAAVTHPGEVELTLHEFDHASKSWGPAIGHSRRRMERDQTEQWVRFVLDPVPLQKDASYGFQLHSRNAIIGIGEAVSNARNPFPYGYSWNGHHRTEDEHFFRFFSMTFKLEMCA
ncbi:MAG: hypothetical protein RJA57_1085 [Bacteroidota bacterium]